MVLNATPKSSSHLPEGYVEPISGSLPIVEAEEGVLIERGTFRAVSPQAMASATLDKLHSVFAPELEGPAKMIYRPILLAAIGIHALILFPSNKPAEKVPDKKEKPVTISQVATGKKAPVAKVPTTKIPPTKPPLPKLNKPASTAPITKPKSEPAKPEQTKPESAKPENKPLPDLSPMPPGGAKANDPFADFVHHPAAQAGCYDSPACYKVASSTIASVAATFDSSLKAKGFALVETDKNAERRVIEVTKGGTTNFLTIFQDGGDIVYVLAPNPVNSLDDLRNALTLPSAFVDILTDIPLPPADPSDPGAVNSIPLESDFNEPSKYFVSEDQFLPIIDGSPKIFMNLEPEYVYRDHFEPRLKSIFQAVEQDGEYGGGKVYRLKTAKGAFYLNIVPHAKDPANSIVVIFNAKPS
jgi:hypothetical protein